MDAIYLANNHQHEERVNPLLTNPDDPDYNYVRSVISTETGTAHKGSRFFTEFEDEPSPGLQVYKSSLIKDFACYKAGYSPSTIDFDFTRKLIEVTENSVKTKCRGNTYRIFTFEGKEAPILNCEWNNCKTSSQHEIFCTWGRNSCWGVIFACDTCCPSFIDPQQEGNTLNVEDWNERIPSVNIDKFRYE